MALKKNRSIDVDAIIADETYALLRKMIKARPDCDAIISNRRNMQSDERKVYEGLKREAFYETKKKFQGHTLEDFAKDVDSCSHVAMGDTPDMADLTGFVYN